MAEPLSINELEEAEHEWATATPDPVDYERIKRWVIQRDGKDYIQYNGLVDLLHQVSGGHFRITTRLEQAPSAENGQTAIVSAIAILVDPTAPFHDIAWASGLGDANPGNVTRMMEPHKIRMAETRAKGRALRDLLNVGMVVAEELGPDGPAHSDESRGGNGKGQVERAAAVPETATAASDKDTITIDGVVFTRTQVWGYYVQRMNQCKERNVSIPQPLLNNKVALEAIVKATQTMKSSLAKAGALAPAGAAGAA